MFFTSFAKYHYTERVVERIYKDLESTSKNIIAKLEIKEDIVLTANMTKVFWVSKKIY